MHTAVCVFFNVLSFERAIAHVVEDVLDCRGAHASYMLVTGSGAMWPIKSCFVSEITWSG